MVKKNFFMIAIVADADFETLFIPHPFCMCQILSFLIHQFKMSPFKFYMVIFFP